MSENKKKQNIVLRIAKSIAHRFVEVRQEMKRVIWTSKEKLVQVTVIVLVVILASAIILSLAGQGSKYLLGKTGFYNQATATTTVATTAATTAATTTAAETTAAAATTTAA